MSVNDPVNRFFWVMTGILILTGTAVFALSGCVAWNKGAGEVGIRVRTDTSVSAYNSSDGDKMGNESSSGLELEGLADLINKLRSGDVDEAPAESADPSTRTP